MDDANELPNFPPEEELLQLLPAKPMMIEGVAIPSRLGFVKATAGLIRRNKWETIRRQRREAPEIAVKLLALPDAEARRAIRRSRGRMYSVALVAWLTARSGKIAPSNTQEGLRLADLAATVLQQIPKRIREQHYSPRYWLDLWAGIKAERGNALRILGRSEEARREFREVLSCICNGTGDVLLEARVLSLWGSLLWSRGWTRAASKVLNLAANAYAELGEEGLLGKVQLQQAALLDDRGLLPEAIELLQEAMLRLDEDAEPVTVLAAHANLAEMMHRTGSAVSALSVLSVSTHLAEQIPGAPALGKWFWIRGRCRMATGSFDGEGDLLNAWRILEPTGDTYSLGLVGVDLCRHYLDACNLKQLEHWISPTVAALSQHGSSPDMVRELDKLRESVQKLGVNAALAKSALRAIEDEMDQGGWRSDAG